MIYINSLEHLFRKKKKKYISASSPTIKARNSHICNDNGLNNITIITALINKFNIFDFFPNSARITAGNTNNKYIYIEKILLYCSIFSMFPLPPVVFGQPFRLKSLEENP